MPIAKLTLSMVASPLIILFSLSVAGDLADGKQPRRDKEFTLPKSLHGDFSDYRNQWIRLNNIDYSGLHWQQFITVYTKHGQVAYKHNHLAYRRWYEDPDDEDNDIPFKKYPIGTAFVKENFTSHHSKPGKLSTVTAMIKRRYKGSTNGDSWEYIQFDTDGNIIVQGGADNTRIARTCANCHASVAERDYIFATTYSASEQ